MSVRSLLDRESIANLNVTVKAIAVTRPDLVSFTTLEITVSDVNDNPPQFTNNTYTILVPESTPIGRELLRVSAIDVDITETAVIYGVENGPNSSGILGLR